MIIFKPNEKTVYVILIYKLLFRQAGKAIP